MARKPDHHQDEVLISDDWLSRLYRLEWVAVALLCGCSLWLLAQAAIH